MPLTYPVTPIMATDLEAAAIAAAKAAAIQRIPRPATPSGCVISLKNLPKNCTNDELRPVFELFGQVNVISVTRDVYTGEKRRFGFIRYASQLAAVAAATMFMVSPLIIRGSRVAVALSEVW